MNTFGAILLWVEILLSLLLAMAAVFAWTARWSSGVGRVAVRAIITLACLIPTLGFLGLSLVLKTEQIVHNALMFSLPLAVGYCIGGIVIGRINRVRVAQWPVMRLWIAALVALSLTGMTLWNLDMSSQLRMQVARADAAALGVSVAPPMVPDDQNAAIIYNSVAELLKDKKIEKTFEDLCKLYDPEIPLDVAKAADYVDQLHDVISRIEQAARRPYCRFDHPYSHASFAMMLPELAMLRKSGILLSYAAHVAAYRGQPEPALRLTSAIYSIQEHAGNSPVYVSGLLAIGIGGCADAAVLRLLPAVTDAQQLSSLHLPSEDGLPRIMDRALVSEEACDTTAWVDVFEDSTVVKQGMSKRFAERRSGPILNEMIPALHELIAASSITLSRFHSWPYELDALHESIQLARNLSNTPVYQWKETQVELTESNTLYARQGPLTYVLLPYFVSGTQATSGAIAYRRMVQMALAATRYRLERGHYPAEAAELVPTYLPALPIDPFDGKPLRMKTEADGLLFYSVGRDRTDDGGLEGPVAGRANYDDLMHLKTPEAFHRSTTTQPVDAGK